MYKEFSWRTGRSCVFKNHIHLVFVTKYRRDVFTEEMLVRLEELFDETCLQMEGNLLEFNGEDNHVHLMVSCPPKLALATLVSKLKGKSSYFLRQEYWEKIKNKLWGNHFWSPSYCAVSCGGASLDVIKEYIESQKRPQKDRCIRQSQQFTGKQRDKNKNWI